MSSIRTSAEKPRYRRFADMTWPTVDGNLQWKLRYAPESVSREDQMYLASVVGAYAALSDANQKKRNLQRLVDRGKVERKIEGNYPDCCWLYRVKKENNNDH